MLHLASILTHSLNDNKTGWGDVLAIVDNSGTEVVTYNYDAWGNIISTSGTMASTLGKYDG